MVKINTTLINRFTSIYGNPPDIQVTVPARINLMGVHIEHRGGWVNYMAIGKKATFLARRRDDDRVVFNNTNREFGARGFVIGRELPPRARGDWQGFLRKVRVRRGDWENYIRGGVLVLQDKSAARKLAGMDLLVDSDIPISAGLSSSGAMVVGTVLALARLNRLKLNKRELPELCMYGEWYSGVRCGPGDQAAMLMSRRGQVMRTRFFPLRLQYIAFPRGYSIVVCNSLVEASKSGNVRNRFNERITTNQLALLLARKMFPERAADFVHLRDLLKPGDSWVYQLLKRLPDRVTRQELAAELKREREELKKLFATHEEPGGGYEIKNVATFGLAECRRGEMTARLLRERDMDTLGRLMYVSHDGDRVVTYAGHGEREKEWANEVTVEGLEGARDEALAFQAGAYGCSCRQLDFLVDTARGVPGVLGAGLTGGGMGGCVLVLARRGSVPRLLEVMEKRYYRPRKLAMGAWECVPSGAAEVVKL